MKKEKLYLFVEDFSGPAGENFFEKELPFLLERFEKIVLMPLNPGNRLKESIANVEVVQFDLFKGCNRIRIFFGNLFLVCSIFFYELMHTHNKLFYITKFPSLLNLLVLRIASAQRLKNFIGADLDQAVFYTYWFNQWTFSLAVIKHQFPGLKLVSRIHGKDYDETQVKTVLPFRYYELSKINMLYPASDYGRKYMAEAFNFNRAVTSHLGLNINGGLSPVNAAELHVVSCSALIPLKRVHLVPGILAQIGIPVKWTHFGGGPLMENIKSQVQKLPAHVKVDLKGQVDNPAIIQYLKDTPVSFFIHVSETEGGVPVCLSEAAAFGIPLIGTDVCGIPEIVNSETGHLLPLDFKPAEVAAYIEKQHKSGAAYDKNYRERIRAFYFENFYAPKNYSGLASRLVSV